jgi:hypothetical protein
MWKITLNFKHSVKDNQIKRQKLQITNLLVLELILYVTWHGIALSLTPSKKINYCRPYMMHCQLRMFVVTALE